MDTSERVKKMDELLKSEDYQILERRVYKCLQSKLRSRLTPHYFKSPHICGLSGVHIDYVPLRPIVNSYSEF